MALIKSMVSSRTVEWETPQKLFDRLDKEFHFTLDPCATKLNHKCEKYFTLKENGLMQCWKDEVVFMNPPYGGYAGKWIEKAYCESKNQNATVVCLMVSSTDRSYWHEFIFPYASQIRFIRGRIKFGDANSTAPFASAIIIFDSRKEYEPRIVYYRKKQFLF